MLTSTALNPNWSLLEKVLPQAPPFPPPARALTISLLYPTTRKLSLDRNNELALSSTLFWLMT
jgi:hypothetical protein